MAWLDAVSSIVHLKITYHDEKATPVTVDTDLQKEGRTRRIIHEDVLTSYSRGNDEFDLDARGDEVRLPWTTSLSLCNLERI